MRVLASEAVQDPTKVEAHVRAQMAARQKYVFYILLFGMFVTDTLSCYRTIHYIPILFNRL